MEQAAAARDWARDEFGGSELGDGRLTARIVQTAAGALCRPSSTISGTFGRTAAAEGAFRLVENDRVCVDKLADASHGAAARRCAEHARVIVPIDSTSLLIRDPHRLRGLGPLSAISYTLRGIHAFHALAVDPAGATLGIVGRQFWLREEKATLPKGKKNRLPPEERESHRWVTMLESVQAQMQKHAPNSEPWFQLDRGGDCWMVIDHAVERGLMLTVRASQNRLLARKGTQSTRLFQAIRAVAPVGVLQLAMPRGHQRKARHASLVLRCARFAIPVPSHKKEQRRRTIGVVMVSEKDPPADGSPKIEWILLTTHDVGSAADATEVVRAYTRRWRIEEFHRTWKNGVCGIESTRLRAYDHIQRWAIIMGSVAARIEQLKFTSRTTPELSAEDFFTRDEIDAVILLTSRHRKIPYVRGQTPTMGEVTRWISYLGGYMGSKNSLPPGSVVLARGLEQIETAAGLLDTLRQVPKTKRPRGR